MFCIDKDHKEAMMAAWKTLTTRQLFSNPWLGLRQDEVITPAGNPGNYVVVEFKNRAVGVVPLTAEGNVVLVRQTRYAVGNISSLEIPKGGCPQGEAWHETAHRELAEETGYRAGAITPLFEGVHLSNSISNEVGALFVATDLQPGVQMLEESEDIEVETYSFDEALSMVLTGQITDAMSVMGLLLLAQHRQRFSL
jgi:8-oxo-dGTP pyrophosphatase MutT (NUDIX family)